MREFELALHPEKTRLIRFGRHAAKQREKLGEGKPETFDFLGFTHFCTRSRKWGSFVIGRKTIKKRMLRAKLQAVKMELRKTNARPHRENRSVGEADAARASELLRRLRQRPEPVVVLQRGALALAQVAQAAQPEGASLTGRSSPGSPTASSRRSGYYTHCPVTASTPKPEGGARCVSSARRDLCGGRGAILVPTATLGLTPFVHPRHSAKC